MMIRSFRPGRMIVGIYKNDFPSFVHRAFIELNPGSTFMDCWYIWQIASELEDIRLGRSRRLIVNLPPRHLKSFVISVAYVAWVLGHQPRARLLVVCYGQDLSDKLARDCRTLMQCAFYKALFGTRLSPDRQAVSEFETTRGGYRMSTSVGGVLTGRGADIIIIDDPMKADEALSETRRAYVKEWFDNTLRTRLNNQETGAIIIVMQRLHAYDLVAHVQQHERWNVLSLPAIAEHDQTYQIRTPYGPKSFTRCAGDILHPGLVSALTLEGLRQSMTEYHFAAQFQQDPQPLEGNIVKRTWLHRYDPKDMPDTFDQVVQSWDTANKVTELSDCSACTTWGVKENKLYLLDAFRRKMKFPDLTRMVRELATLWRATVVLVEDKASGMQLIQQLRADGFSIIRAAPDTGGDKIMRLMAQTAKIEGGFALFPKDAPWLGEYLHELTSFPNSRYDDQVDSTVYALAWLTAERTKPGMGGYYALIREAEAAERQNGEKPKICRVRVSGDSTHYIPKSGRNIMIPPDRIIEVDEVDKNWCLKSASCKLIE